MFNIASGVSLVLCLATAVLCVRSYFATEVLRYQPRIDWVLRAYMLGWGKGHLVVGVGLAEGPESSGWKFIRRPPQRLYNDAMANAKQPHLFGIRLVWSEGTVMIHEKVTEWFLFIPYWVAMIASAVLPALWLKRHRKERIARRRLIGGLCVQCGYDLRASRERCPECGTAIPAGGAEEGRGGGDECVKGCKQRDATGGENLKR
ncbi:MAG TPA: hypothetical protein VHP11_13965 [Tepidisphaeraceae bacterium]|nr:hypothetical protein [Tepidisphaeraceae bacterium]